MKQVETGSRVEEVCKRYSGEDRVLAARIQPAKASFIFKQPDARRIYSKPTRRSISLIYPGIDIGKIQDLEISKIC
ncbi:hypothetical protein WCU72_09480, partial [Pectobacterium parmentieri]|uniref:hypothetical protein n=1 Tax=Pectobacterium parmentieri TaxID=1905730 RepID=UPI00301B50B8